MGLIMKYAHVMCLTPPQEFGTNTKALPHGARDTDVRWFTARNTTV